MRKKTYKDIIVTLKPYTCVYVLGISKEYFLTITHSYINL